MPTRFLPFAAVTLATTSAHTHRSALNAEHPVDAVWATAIPSPPGGLALAHHDIVLVLHFPLAVGQDVVLNELPDGGHATSAGALLLELVLSVVGEGEIGRSGSRVTDGEAQTNLHTPR